jgi:hypothetical protein
LTISSRFKHRVALTALAVGALLAVNVSAASATTWNPTPTGGYVTAPSGFTLYKNGGSATTCTIPGKGWNGFFFGSGVSFAPVPSGADCAGSTKFGWQLEASASLVEGGYRLNPFLTGGSKEYVSPWGTYQQCYFCGSPAPIGTWQNGSGATPSTWTFNKQAIGKVGGQVITISGTFNVTTLEGGLLTLK